MSRKKREPIKEQAPDEAVDSPRGVWVVLLTNKSVLGGAIKMLCQDRFVDEKGFRRFETDLLARAETFTGTQEAALTWARIACDGSKWRPSVFLRSEIARDQERAKRLRETRMGKRTRDLVDA